ncbi:hypothetical protein IAD21_06112 [Abditibacteriota bacterium]|nr:hypothetical protein IAD21_06112 [Abditibacteriota bacterium]
MDLREWIVAAWAARECVDAVATCFGVCTKTVRSYYTCAQQDNLPPRPRLGRVVGNLGRITVWTVNS